MYDNASLVSCTLFQFFKLEQFVMYFYSYHFQEQLCDYCFNAYIYPSRHPYSDCDALQHLINCPIIIIYVLYLLTVVDFVLVSLCICGIEPQVTIDVCL